MQHRRPGAACPLCPLYGPPWDDDDPATHGRQHDHARALWAAWEEKGRWDKTDRWEKRIVEIAAELGVACTVEQVREHFRWHEIEQPHPGRLNRREALAAGLELHEIERQILLTVFRQRILSRDQLTELFFNGRYPESSARVLAHRVLTGLAREHFLYRYFAPRDWVEQNRRRSHLLSARGRQSQPLFLLGKAALPLLETLGIKVGADAATTRAATVGTSTLIHDLRSAEIYVQLVRALRERDHLISDNAGRSTRAFALVENWHGQRALELRFTDPDSGLSFKSVPDGFATLSLEGSGFGADDIPPCQLPFWIEFDNASKKEKKVAEQLYVFHRVARAGTVRKLFPDLDIDGYAAPILMVFPDELRLRRVRAAFRRYADTQRRETGVPIFLTTEEEWNADPFAAPLRHAWDRDDPRTLTVLDALLLANEKLLGPLPALAPRQVLRHTPSALPQWSYDKHKKAVKV